MKVSRRLLESRLPNSRYMEVCMISSPIIL
nr:MAG TPA: hypothetical protein [Caudoviricetes sp.]